MREPAEAKDPTRKGGVFVFSVLTSLLTTGQSRAAARIASPGSR